MKLFESDYWERAAHGYVLLFETLWGGLKYLLFPIFFVICLPFWAIDKLVTEIESYKFKRK